MLVVGIRIGSFGRIFGLTILVDHPDRSGGLNPLGDLAALSGVILAVPAIYLSLWLIYTSSMYNYYFVFMLVIVVVLALLAFLGPLCVLHVDIVRYGEPVRRCLDAVRVEMERACKNLQNQIATTPPETPAPSSSDAAEVSRTTTMDAPRAASAPPSATPSPMPNDVDSGIRKAWMEQIASLQKFSETCTVPEWPFDRQVALKFVVPQILPWLTVLFQLTDNWRSILGPILGFP